MTCDEIRFLVAAAQHAGVGAIEFQRGDAILRVVLGAEDAPRCDRSKTSVKDESNHALSKDGVIRSPQMGRFSIAHPGSHELPTEGARSHSPIVGYVSARGVVLPVSGEAGRKVDALVADGAIVGYGDAVFRYAGDVNGAQP